MACSSIDGFQHLRVPEILAPFLPKILTLPIPEILAVWS
jgi:hypothetical protein